MDSASPLSARRSPLATSVLHYTSVVQKLLILTQELLEGKIWRNQSLLKIDEMMRCSRSELCPSHFRMLFCVPFEWWPPRLLTGSPASSPAPQSSLLMYGSSKYPSSSPPSSSSSTHPFSRSKLNVWRLGCLLVFVKTVDTACSSSSWWSRWWR